VAGGACLGGISGREGSEDGKSELHVDDWRDPLKLIGKDGCREEYREDISRSQFRKAMLNPGKSDWSGIE
jgi:hypothetical protein